jgi:hypothetical protein
MAITIDVTTPNEFMAALERAQNNYENSPITINILNDLDFNDSNYYERDADFFITGYSSNSHSIDLTIEGNGHTISNIYLYPGRRLLLKRYGVLTISNLTFEVISNNSTIFYSGSSYDTANFINVVFNVKLYSFYTNNLFDFDGSGGTSRFERCVFNLYFNHFSTSYSSTTPTISQSNIFYLYRNNNYSKSCTFQACIIRIRNRTSTKLKKIFGVDSSGTNLKLDNCAIFYNDVGPVKPSYDDSVNNIVLFASNSSQDQNTKFYNSYIAAFGTVASVDKPHIVYMTNCSQSNIIATMLTSFYDTSKIKIDSYYSGSAFDIPATGLTTAQCKDGDTLSAIGYIFCEET